MTDQRLNEIRERVEAATPGPWHTDDCAVWADGEQNVYQGGEGREYISTAEGGYVVGEFLTEDARLVAHARQDVPDLLAEVDRLKAENRDLHTKLSLYADGRPVLNPTNPEGPTP